MEENTRTKKKKNRLNTMMLNGVLWHDSNQRGSSVTNAAGKCALCKSEVYVQGGQLRGLADKTKL